MPTFGKLDEYNETEDWRHYIERVNHFFGANEITDPDKRRSIFLVSVGAKTYKLIRSLVAPEDPKDKSYEDLSETHPGTFHAQTFRYCSTIQV